jgi:C1A family cysteine protease
MIKKGILLGGLFVFCFLGILFALSDSAPSENREVRTAQDAIAAEELSWQAEVTPLSLLSREERLKRLGGRLSEVPVQMTTEDFPAPMALPALLDWRDLGGNWITSIKDQGDCGSCWAFATTALLEAMVKISKHMSQDIDLSEQMLLSCSNAGDCVLGGYEYKAAEYIKMTGIPNEGCYPYTATEAPCNPCAGWAARAVRITSWSWVSTSATGIETALQSGPVTSWMGVYSDFYHYRSGVYQPTAGSSYEGGHRRLQPRRAILDLQEFLGNGLGRKRFFSHQNGNLRHRHPGAAHDQADPGQRAAGAAEHSRLLRRRRPGHGLHPERH